MLIRIIGGEYLTRAGAKNYPVAAVYFGSKTRALVDVEWFPTAPMAVPECDFQLVDGRVSRHWQYGVGVAATDDAIGRPPMLGFKEWVNDLKFFERLVNGDPAARIVWEQRRAQIEVEYLNPQISRRAIWVDSGWLECGNCSHVFEYEGLDEMVKCEKCLVVQAARWNAVHR